MNDSENEKYSSLIDNDNVQSDKADNRHLSIIFYIMFHV